MTIVQARSSARVFHSHCLHSIYRHAFTPTRYCALPQSVVAPYLLLPPWLYGRTGLLYYSVVPRVRSLPLETATVERYQWREVSFKKATTSRKRFGPRTSSGKISRLNRKIYGHIYGEFPNADLLHLLQQARAQSGPAFHSG